MAMGVFMVMRSLHAGSISTKQDGGILVAAVMAIHAGSTSADQDGGMLMAAAAAMVVFMATRSYTLEPP